MPITQFDAANLAHLYHDVMNMVSRRSHTNVMVGPRKLLENYLKACEKVGVELHNEYWLAHAERVVAELEVKRREAWKVASDRAAKAYAERKAATA